MANRGPPATHFRGRARVLAGSDLQIKDAAGCRAEPPHRDETPQPLLPLLNPPAFLPLASPPPTPTPGSNTATPPPLPQPHCLPPRRPSPPASPRRLALARAYRGRAPG